MLEKTQVLQVFYKYTVLLQSLFFRLYMHIYAHLVIYIPCLYECLLTLRFLSVILGCSHYSQEEKPRPNYEDNF